MPGVKREYLGSGSLAVHGAGLSEVMIIWRCSLRAQGQGLAIKGQELAVQGVELGCLGLRD